MALPTPLTTIFTPPAVCFTDLYIVPDNAAWLGPGTQCIPDGPNPTLSQYFSPGIYCPSGFTVACQSEVNVGTLTQTQATCCPRVNDINGISASPFSCQTDKTAFPWYSTFGCTLNYGSMVDNGAFTLTYTTNGTQALTTMQAKSSWGLNAYSVQLAWQASDLLTTTTSPIQSSTSGRSGTSGPGVVTVTAESTSSASQATQESENSGMSRTAKIAIGVVIPVVVILGIAIGVYLLMKRRKNRSANYSAQATTTDVYDSGKPMYNASTGGPGTYDTYPQKHEMSAEHTSPPTVHELGSGKQR